MILSPKQQEIVDTQSKYCHVIAGAGSGKTRTLTERVKKILHSCRPGEMALAITFSNKAANELRERLLLYFSEDELSENAYVGTVHNFCMDLVTTRGHAIGLPSDLHIFESEDDRLEIFKDALNSIPYLKAKYESDRKQIRSLFYNLGKQKRSFRFPSDLNNKPILKMLYEEYNNLMLMQNAIDFDDILLYAYRILTEKESIARIYQRIYKHILVDEAQDLNKSQYEVIKSIAGISSSIFMVGDPSQAIYGFNGSSSKYMCEIFPKEFNANKFILDENFRSSLTVINAAKVIEPSFEIEGKLPIQGECSMIGFEDEESEAQWIVQKIESLITEGHDDIEGRRIMLEQCAILGRTKYVFNKLIDILDQSGNLYHLRASANQGLNSESIMFKVFDLSLRLLINEKDKIHLDELLNLLNLPKGEIQSFELLRDSSIIYTVLGKELCTIMRKCWDILSSENFKFNKVLEMLKRYCDTETYFDNEHERLLAYNDCLAWQDRWNIYVRNTSIEDRSLTGIMRSIALGITTINNEQGLTLSTVHMSKGLEFDVVFIMGLNEGTFPDYRSLNDDDQLEEEKHNMFVSITRSKRLCYLTFPKKKIMPWGDARSQKPSRYLYQLGWKDQ